MELKTEKTASGVSLLRLIGRLDMEGVQKIEPHFNEAASNQKKNVIVDLSAVDFIASIGIRMLVSNAKLLTRSGARMIILDPTLMVESVLNTAGIQHIIPIEKDLAAAESLLS